MSDTPRDTPEHRPPGSDPVDPPPPAPPPPPTGSVTATGASTAGRTAGLGVRLGARLLDSILVGVVMFVILLVVPGLSPTGGIGNTLSALVGFAYFVYFEGTSGQTLLKRAFNLKVVDASGGAASIQDAVKRNWWLLLGVLGLIPVIGLIASLASLVIVIWIMVTIASDPANRGVHDNWGGTQVVRTT